MCAARVPRQIRPTAQHIRERQNPWRGRDPLLHVLMVAVAGLYLLMLLLLAIVISH